MLGYQLTCEPRYRSLDTVVLPDPLLTQGGPVTCVHCTTFSYGRATWHIRVCILFTCLYLYTPQLLAASALLCPSLSFFRAHMDELQNMRLPLGTTGWNDSYYTGIPLSALHSLQQLQTGASSPSPVQISASTTVTLCSDFKLCVLPTGYTQCHLSTGSDGPHPHCHK